MKNVNRKATVFCTVPSPPLQVPGQMHVLNSWSALVKLWQKRNHASGSESQHTGITV